jgi:hypothetical protein
LNNNCPNINIIDRALRNGTIIQNDLDLRLSAFKVVQEQNPLSKKAHSRKIDKTNL